ncbi:MAG: hypothetical protein HQL77_05220 [Magnetococcales bacterium]|nr:hypothetical protein [Magnetococcales bacterium]
MARYYFIGLVVCMVGIGLGYMLLPSAQTLALIYLRDHDYGRALELLEGEQVTTVAEAMRLSNLYLHNGQVDQAILVLEAMVKKHPNHHELRQELGKLYQNAQRERDYLANLEESRQMQPSLEILQQLANLYSFYSDPEKQIHVLEEMVKRYPGQIAGYRDLAAVLMAESRFDRVVTTLRAMKTQHRRSMDGESLHRLVYALLKLGQEREALAEARSWLDGPIDEQTIGMIEELLYQGGSAELAWLWLEDVRRQLPNSMDVMLRWGRLAAQTGRGENVLPVLEGYWRRGELPAAGIMVMSEVAVRLKWYGKAMRIMASLPVGQRPYWLQRTLGEEVLAAGGGFAARGVMQVAEPQFLEDYPVLAAELSLRAGVSQKDLQHWLDRGKVVSLEPEWRVRLAILFLRLGRLAEGGGMLRALARETTVPPAVFRELAGYYIQTRDIKGGIAFFAQLRQGQTNASVEEAWMLLLVSSGDHQGESLAWLAARTELSEAFLSDLANRALDTGQLKLAHTLVERLGQDDGQGGMIVGQESLGRTLLRARLDWADGKFMAALQRLRPLYPVLDANGHQLYEDVVIAAWRDKQPVRPEVLALVRRHLGTPGRVGDLERLRLYGMLAWEVGERGLGAKALMDAAAHATPDSPEMKQLLYVLGPRPEKAALDWLLHRTRGAGDQDLAGWVDVMTGIGQAERALLIAEPKRPAPGRNPALVDALVRAYRSMKNNEKMAEILNGELMATSTVPRLHALADLAEGGGLSRVAEKVYQTLLKVDANDEKALKRLGYMAFYAGEWERTVGYLGRYVSRYDDNYEPFFFLAEVYRSLGMIEKAKPFYLKALAKIDKMDRPQHSVRVAWTRMTERVGRWAEALKGYAGLLREQPGDKRLKADYVELLLARGMTQEANQVLRAAGVH